MLTLVHERLDELAAAMPHIAENVGPGCDAVLAKLEHALAAEGDGQVTTAPPHQRENSAMRKTGLTGPPSPSAAVTP
jgi:hypothetical protein